MEHLDQQQQYTMIAQFYASHIEKRKPFTVHHFCDSGVNKRKVYRVIGQYEKGEAMFRKTGSGRKALKMPQGKIRKLKAFMNERIGATQNLASKKFGVSQQYIGKI